MNVTWVRGYPSGHEKGSFLALDMGGTNLRVCEVEFSGGKGEFDRFQHEYKIPDAFKTGSSLQLWDFVAERVALFVRQRFSVGQTSTKIPLAFTFSYPVHQPCIDRGILQRWTKDFNIPGVEGSDVIVQLEEAFERKVGVLHALHVPIFFATQAGIGAMLIQVSESARKSRCTGKRYDRYPHSIIVQRPRSPNRQYLWHRL